MSSVASCYSWHTKEAKKKSCKALDTESDLKTGECFEHICEGVAITVRLNFHHLELNALKKVSSDLLILMLVVRENLLSAKPCLQKIEQKLRLSMLFVSGLPLHVYYIICRFTCQTLCFKNWYKISFSGQLPHLWIMHILFSVLHIITNAKSLQTCFRFAALHSKMVFWCWVHTHYVLHSSLLLRRCIVAYYYDVA